MMKQNPDGTPPSRLFIAVELPPALQERIAQRRPALRPMDWAAPEQLHLTLAFVGAWPKERMSALDSALGQVHFAPFCLELDRIGSFNNRLLWLGCGLSEPLVALHQEIGRALCAIGMAVDARPFTPHVTLGRVQGGIHAALLQRIEAALLPTPLLLPVDQFALKNSILTGRQPLHQQLRLYDAQPLRAPPDPAADRP